MNPRQLLSSLLGRWLICSVRSEKSGGTALILIAHKRHGFMIHKVKFNTSSGLRNDQYECMYARNNASAWVRA